MGRHLAAVADVGRHLALTTTGLRQAGQHAEAVDLPAPFGAQEPEDRAAFHLQGQAIQGMHLAVEFSQGLVIVWMAVILFSR